MNFNEDNLGCDIGVCVLSIMQGKNKSHECSKVCHFMVQGSLERKEKRKAERERVKAECEARGEKYEYTVPEFIEYMKSKNGGVMPKLEMGEFRLD